ncbi:hypothetical protein ACWD33_27425, partial [Streptomyces xiamenensis]
EDLGLTLELGTRGVRTEHLARYLEIAEALGVNPVRTAWSSFPARSGPAFPAAPPGPPGRRVAGGVRPARTRPGTGPPRGIGAESPPQ